MYDINRMKKEIPIEDVCSMLGITLGKRNGVNIFGSIRNERTGSFSINPEKNIWRDWGTSEGGNVIDLVMKIESIDMGRAVQMLADRFNYQKQSETSANTTYLPTKKQFEEIGVIAERTLSNFDLNLEKQSIEKVEELEKQYSISVSELSSKNPKLYHRIIDKKALPIISMERNLLIDTLKIYKTENVPLARAFIKSTIKDLEKSLNTKIDIYNKARLDATSKDNLKLHIADRLPDEVLETKITSSGKTKNNVEEIKDKLSDELDQLELKISNLDNKIGTYSNDLSSNKGKYHIYIDDNSNTIEMFFAVTNTKKEATEIKKDTYLKTNRNTTIRNLKDEIPKLKEEVSNLRATYDVKMEEYLEILNQANPFSNKKDIEELYNKDLTQEHIEREIGDIMNEIKETPLIDMKVDKEVDVSEILENLKNGVGNIFNNENFIEYLNFQSQFHKYSPNNSLLIAIQNPQATNVASFNKWKSLGRMVNKGEKGIMILAPNVTKNGFKDIMARLDKYGKTNVSKYTFTKNNNSYSISSFGKNFKIGLTQNELESFIKINKLSQNQMNGFRKIYVFDVSQTFGEPIPEFKLKFDDTNLLNKNGFYKNPLIKVHSSEGGLFEQDQTLTFKQMNEVFNRKEHEIRNLKKEYETKGEYYPYFKQRFDVILKPESQHDVAKDIRVHIGDGEYNTLLEALKGEMIGYPQVFETLAETINSNETDMETILALKNQLEKTCINKGIELEYIGDTKSANGYFTPSINKISVNSEMSFSLTTKTLLHEYVHSQLHVNGLQSKDNLNDRQTGEIEAEATTYVVAKNFGFDTSEYSFDYVSTWARGKEVKELEQTLKTIKVASEKIINELKAPLELEIYNTKETIEEILRNEHIKPNDKIINNMLDINKETVKINTISDLVNAEKFKSYPNQELSNKISETNKEIVTNTVKIEVKTTNLAMER